MTRGCAGALVAFALIAGLGLRLARLNVRPMHHDEANQAIKFGALLERGEYRYDAHDHHGPTLYYLTLPAAWIRGQHTLASLDERTLRGVPAVVGAASIALVALLSPGIGRTAAAASAWLMALSPAMVFYSRMFIQEALAACFTLAFIAALGRLVGGGGMGWAAAAGLAAGLTIATKETSVIVLPAAVLACGISWWSVRARGFSSPLAGTAWRSAAVILAAAIATAAVFYSSFLAEPGAITAPLFALPTYFDRGTAPASHSHPWHYYLGLLSYSSAGGLRWSEGLVLGLGAIGAVAAWVGPRTKPGSDARRVFWTRYLAWYAVMTTAIFSAIPYKTPWNLLPFYLGVLVVAGSGFSAIVAAAPSRLRRGMLILVFGAAAAHLGWQAWRASVTYAADTRNPYVYAQTLPDAVRMAARIRALTALHPDRDRMLVSVVASPYEQWPLPWYLRMMPHVGYWTGPGDALAMRPPVVVSSMEHTASIDAALGERYVSEFYGLRPDVLLVLYIERGLWDRFLPTVAGPSSVR